MANDPNQIQQWAKAKLFGNTWSPEDQEWGFQDFMKSMGWSQQDLETAIKNNRFDEHSANWFKTRGHAGAKARNEQRDQSGGLLEGQAGYTTPEQRKQAGIDAEAANAQDRTNTINTQLDEFYRQLSQPIDPNDPEIVRVASQAGRSAATAAYGRGIEGGAAVANTERTAGAAAADMFQRERERRDGLRAQVGGLRAGGAMNQQQFQQSQQQMADAQRRYAEGLRYQDQMDQYNAGMQRAQGLGGAIGAGIGALGFLGGPAVGAATTSAGMGLGAGIGGLSYRPPPKRSYSGGY